MKLVIDSGNVRNSNRLANVSMNSMLSVRGENSAICNLQHTAIYKLHLTRPVASLGVGVLGDSWRISFVNSALKVYWGYALKLPLISTNNLGLYGE